MANPRTAPALAFAAGLTGGVLFAMATGIVMSHYGVELFGVWRGLFSTTQAQLRFALAWWATAGAAFVAGFVISLVMSRFEWLYLRSLRGWLAAALTLGLAALAREAPSAQGIAAEVYVAANLAAIAVAAAMAAFGSYFGLRR